MCVYACVCVINIKSKEMRETKSGIVVTFGVMGAGPGMDSGM